MEAIEIVEKSSNGVWTNLYKIDPIEYRKKEKKRKERKKTLLYITLKEIVKEEKPKRGILEQKLSVLFYDNVQLREWIERWPREGAQCSTPCNLLHLIHQ